MTSIREQLEKREKAALCPQAALSSHSGRERPEPACPFRTAFQKDRDKIIHSKSFRRLKHKTQVFLSPLGDHYRTRMTHSLEVMQIGRTIARALRLNEDLVEAAALGHDLGHTPFGHSGEAVLNEIHPGGFHHVKQSVRIVEKLENDGRGLNLTKEVTEAIAKHSKGKGPILTDDPALKARTLEGQIVRIADILAYINHDLDDAVRAGMLAHDDIPKDIQDVFGKTHARRIETMVSDVIASTQNGNLDKIRMSSEKLEALGALRAFMFDHVYESERTQEELKKAQQAVRALYGFYLKHPKQLLKEMEIEKLTESLEVHVVDFISGMTDRYAVRKYGELVMPHSWHIF